MRDFVHVFRIHMEVVTGAVSMHGCLHVHVCRHMIINVAAGVGVDGQQGDHGVGHW